MYDKSQLMRGTVEGCILKVLEQETAYGYDIVTKLQGYGFRNLREGTIYPLLLRLEKKGMVTAVLRPSPLGPSRKYYTLTAEGQTLLREFQDCWLEISEAVNAILGGNPHAV